MTIIPDTPEADSNVSHDAEQAARNALRDRVRGDDAPDEALDIADVTEASVRSALSGVQHFLAERRAEKKELADTIRDLVEQETVLKRAVAVFDRAAKS